MRDEPSVVAKSENRLLKAVLRVPACVACFHFSATIAVTLFSSLFASSAFAFDGSQVVTGGGSVDFTGVSSTNWVTYVEDGVTKTDFLLVYSNAAETAA